ncbi:hypothetical protein OIU76_016246 [Salix suchowensis]|nr:hypothetical protein OIU76_016246 [Salix suchowensis]
MYIQYYYVNQWFLLSVQRTVNGWHIKFIKHPLP